MHRSPLGTALAVTSALVLSLVLAPVSTASAAGDVTYTADFEPDGVTIHAGDSLTDQYPFVNFDIHNLPGGWTYGTPADGVLYPADYWYPQVYQGDAHRGSYSGRLTACGDVTCAHGVYGQLGYTADSVSVYAGDVGAGEQLRLDAYDLNKHLLGRDIETTTAAGAETRFSVSAPAGSSIAYFALHATGSQSSTDYLYIDDLSITVPAGAAPTVSVSAPFSTYQVGLDGTIHVPLTIHRINGASAPVSLAITGAASGVSASAPDPGTNSTSTLTVSASHTAALSPNRTLRITASATATESGPPLALTIDVVPPIVAFAGPGSVSARTCDSRKFAVTAQVAPGEPGSQVTFSASVQPTNAISAHVTSPATITGGTAATAVTLDTTGGSPTGVLRVTATLSNGDSGTDQIAVYRPKPLITSVAVTAGKVARTPRAQATGSTLRIDALGLCDTATVAVGNQKATDSGTVQHLVGGQGPYDRLVVRTPRLATTGKVTVTTGSPPETSPPSSGGVKVDSYRNTDGWKFQNFDPDLTWDDLVQAFGSDQTYFQIDLCAIFSLGLAHCPGDLMPDPTALAWLGIAKAWMQSGTCFGMALASQRILEGRVPLASLPGHPASIFDAPAPDTGRSAQEVHGQQPVLDLVKSVHLMQLSTEFATAFLGSQTAATAGLTSSSTIAGQVSNVLHKGRYPLIDIVDGVGHVLVAYDIVQTAPSAYDIYVYDVNMEFSPKEQVPATASDLDSGDVHQSRLTASVLHLASNGSWTLPSSPDHSGNPYHGGLANINVFDPTVVPVHPTLASASSAFNNVPGLLAGSAGSGAGGGQHSQATITQVSSAGRTLYGAGGGLNTNPSTRLDASPYAPLVGGAGPQPQLVVVSKDVHDLTVSTTGTATGKASLTFADGSYVGEMNAPTGTGRQGTTSFSAGQGSVVEKGATRGAVSLSVIRGFADGSRTVQAHFDAARGGGLQLAGNGSVAVTNPGAATTYSLTLSGVGPKGLPGTFTTGPLKIGSGATVQVSRIDWGSLGSRHLRMRIGSQTRKLRNESSKVKAPRIKTLRVHRGKKHRVKAKVVARLPKLPPASRVDLLWTARHGHHLLRQHVVHLAVTGRHLRGHWHLKAKGRRVTVTATILAIAVHAAAQSGVVATRSQAVR